MQTIAEIDGRPSLKSFRDAGAIVMPRERRRKSEGGAPTESEWEFNGPDKSWEDEWKDFSQSIQQNRQPLGSAREGLKVMQVIDAVYRSSRLGAAVDIAR